MAIIFECPVCYLSDQTGRRIDPCKENSVQYSMVSCHKINLQKNCEPSGMPVYRYQITVLIQGYVTVYMNHVKVSDPIPFSDIQTLILHSPSCSNIMFTVRKFSCRADPIFSSDQSIDHWELTVKIETIARSIGETDLVVPALILSCPPIMPSCVKDVWISADEIFDRIPFTSEITIPYTRTLLKAEVYQYNAYADEIKKTYTNADEIIEYGDQGILNPNDVSYLSMFINGVLQPQPNYTVAAGLLSLLTVDTPLEGTPILIRFITLIDKNSNLLKGEIYQYNALSDGVKREYTDADELIMYGNQGILDPNDVSFYNVYVNGELQPKTNYVLSTGLLELKTTNVPLAGSPIIAEFVTIKDAADKLLKATLSQYNALADNMKIYTNQDELTVYGNQGIPDPALTSYQNLNINGVIQPSVNYIVSSGLLTLETEDTPIIGVPIYLQSVYLYEQEY